MCVRARVCVHACVRACCVRLCNLRQLRLDREGLVEESFIEVLLGLVHEDADLAVRVELRPARSPHHLQHVGDREVDVALGCAVVELRALDDHQVCWEVHTPRERAC